MAALSVQYFLAATMSFVAPIVDLDTAQPVGALLGRTMLDANPTLSPVVDVLKEGVGGTGEGFIIDAQNHILLYPVRPEYQHEMFELGAATEISGIAESGQAFRQREDDGTRPAPIAGPPDASRSLPGRLETLARNRQKSTEPCAPTV